MGANPTYTDIYSRQVTTGEPWAVDNAKLTFGATSQNDDFSEPGLLIQNLQLTYAQNINRLWEVGHNTVYFVGGRSQGTAGMSRVIGPKPIQRDFMARFGDVCDVAGNIIDFRVDQACDTREGGSVQFPGDTIKASACVIQQVSYQVQAADMIVNEQLALMFQSLSINEAA